GGQGGQLLTLSPRAGGGAGPRERVRVASSSFTWRGGQGDQLLTHPRLLPSNCPPAIRLGLFRRNFLASSGTGQLAHRSVSSLTLFRRWEWCHAEPAEYFSKLPAPGTQCLTVTS